MVEIDVAEALEPIKDLAEKMPKAPVAPAHGIAAIALSLAMKYTDISTVQDGALYQQYKLEGRNMGALHIDMVFETAMQIEVHLIKANKRVTDLMIASLIEEQAEPVEDNSEKPTDASGAQDGSQGQ